MTEKDCCTHCQAEIDETSKDVLIDEYDNIYCNLYCLNNDHDKLESICTEYSPEEGIK